MKELIAVIAAGAIVFAGIGDRKPQAWSRFRGPNGSGVAEGQKPPVEFGPNKNLKWKSPVPSGASSPVIAGDKLIITAFENGKLYTLDYNRLNGNVQRKPDD